MGYRRCWYLSYQDERKGTGRIEVCAGLLPFKSFRFRNAGVILGLHVFRSGLDLRSPLTRDWGRYAALCCRAWNACILAAALCGLRMDTPAGILADALDDQDAGNGLSAYLRDCFLARSGLIDERGRYIPIPEMPSVPHCRADVGRWLDPRPDCGKTIPFGLATTTDLT
jgi:hypothetical protein